MAVLLSDATVEKQKREHGELTLEEYRLVPQILAKGKVITEGQQKLVFFRHHEYLYQATIKTTKDKGENDLVSL